MSAILVVEDNPRLSRLIQINLEAEGYQALVYSDGARASQYLRENVPDLVILDLMLMTLSGWDLLEIIRQDARLEHVPVIVVSAMARPEDRQRALRAGAKQYFVKPFGVRELLSSIKNLLEDVPHA